TNEKPLQPRPLVPSRGRCRSSPKAARQTGTQANAGTTHDSTSPNPFVSYYCRHKNDCDSTKWQYPFSRVARGAMFACDWFPSNSVSFESCPIALISTQLTRN